MSETSNNNSSPCYICKAPHPREQSVHVAKTDLFAGLSCVPDSLRTLLGLPKPEVAALNLDPRPPKLHGFQQDITELFHTVVVDADNNLAPPHITHHDFAIALNKKSLAEIVQARGTAPTARSTTEIENTLVEFHLSPYISTVGRFNVWAEAIINTPEPTLIAAARATWKDLRTPEGIRSHDAIVNLLKS